MHNYTGENYLFHLAWLKFLTFWAKKLTSAGDYAYD